MSIHTPPLQDDWFGSPPPLSPPQHHDRGLVRNPSHASLPATVRSAAGSIAGSNRQSRRITKTNFDEALRNRTIIKFLHGKISANGWIDVKQPSTKPLGVLVRQSTGGYAVEPQDLSPLLVQAVDSIGPKVALTIATESTEAIFDVIQDDDEDILLGDSHLQVAGSMLDVVQPQAENLQFAVLLRTERVLLIWSDDVDQVLIQAANIEERLLELIWGTNPSSPPVGRPKVLSMDSSMVFGTATTDKKKAGFSTPEVIEIQDVEQQQAVKESLARDVKSNGTYVMAVSLFFLVFSIFGYTTSHLVLEYLYDGNTTRFYYIITEPLILIVALFFSLSLVTYIFQIFGPITGLRSNSRFFSANKPNLGQAFAEGFSLPQVTIQMAVYKESLELVVIPTVSSLQAAVRHYEAQGGKANIFITDDGMGYLLHNDPEAAQARIEYYAANKIGWVARPMNGENGYFRTGRFKKASNSNFCMNFSIKVERTLQRLIEERTQSEKGKPIFIDPSTEETLYQQALAEELSNDSRAKAGGNVRLGEVILMVDSDTRVPEDCLIYGAAEMFLSPEVAIIQHYTTVFQVSHDFFENGAAYFAKMCYAQIRYTASNGEYSPFVGHNAFVRWSAIQDVGVMDGVSKGDVMYWSEYHISEDFNMSIRLQSAGWVTRMASYHGEEFKEMVSLTIYDEISRWERYSYGDSELIFNPIHMWWKGPFTKLFRQFVWCDMHLSSKLSILSYMASYYAIGSGFFYTIANYILVGLYPDMLDKFYMQSWNIFLSVVLVYWLLGNIALGVMRYRLGEKSILSSLWENFKWQPMYCFFFYGLSFHINKALIAHIVGYEMTWEMTKKEVENSNFFKEVPKIIKSFIIMYLVMIPMAGGMIYMAFFAPVAWRITEPVATVPMALMIICHCSLPFVLNPYIITAVDEYKQDGPNEGAKTAN